MKKFFPVVLGSTLVLAACGGGSDEDTVVVGGKDFTEQIILTHMVAELIEENTELNVEREENLGNTEILTQGMMDGDIDLYIEYTGTSYITVLNHEIDPENPPTAEEVTTRFKKNMTRSTISLGWMSLILKIVIP